MNAINWNARTVTLDAIAEANIDELLVGMARIGIKLDRGDAASRECSLAIREKYFARVKMIARAVWCENRDMLADLAISEYSLIDAIDEANLNAAQGISYC